MKKLILSALAIFALTTANAQKTKKTNKETEESFNFKPTEGTITTEVGVSGGILNTNFNTINSTVKFRYFIKEDLAVRAGLGLGGKKEEVNTIYSQNTPNQFTVTEVARTTARNFSIGVEKHFAGTDRLSTYVGADITLGFTGAEYKQTQSNNGDSVTVIGSTPQVPSDGISTSPLQLNGAASSTFGVRATTGADYYFTKKLYLGVEVGLAYAFGTRDGVETTTVSGNTTTTTSTGEGKTSTTSTNVIGGLKLGFQF